jgi:glycosyltransferase involved in cell wall biosynthesis
MQYCIWRHVVDLKSMNQKEQKNYSLSLVIPVHNESGNLIPLHAEILDTVQNITPSFEIIYINDGSTDSSLAELKSLSGATIIDLPERRGQAQAFDRGFKSARGDIIISLDGDGQNDPRDIPLLLEKMTSGNFDVVAGWRKNRKDTFSIYLLARVGRLFRFILMKDSIHDSGCSLRAYKKEAAQSLRLDGEMHRYILIMLAQKGYRIGEVVVNHRPRTRGQSKYGIGKAWKGLRDLVRIRFSKEGVGKPS